MNRISTLLFAVLLLTPLAALHAAAASMDAFTLDGKDTGKVFDGIGALSAGASSRLLID